MFHGAADGFHILARAFDGVARRERRGDGDKAGQQQATIDQGVTHDCSPVR
jgi:hypothetical protein